MCKQQWGGFISPEKTALTSVRTFSGIYCCKQASVQHDHLRELLFCSNCYVDSTLTQ
ncbi:hypothetical protein LguiB_005827 [Lonicera macranthoides]